MSPGKVDDEEGHPDGLLLELKVLVNGGEQHDAQWVRWSTGVVEELSMDRAIAAVDFDLNAHRPAAADQEVDAARVSERRLMDERDAGLWNGRGV